MDFAQLPRPFARWWWRVRGTRGVRSKQPFRVPSWSGFEFREVCRGRLRGLSADDKAMEIPWGGDSWLEIFGGAFICFLYVTAAVVGFYSFYVAIIEGGYVYSSFGDASNYFRMLFVSFSIVFLSFFGFIFFSFSRTSFHLLRSRWRRSGDRGQLHRVVFDRENGRVLLPPVGQGEYESVAWDDLVVRDFGVPKPHGGAHRQLKAIRPNDLRVVTIDGDWPDREEFWALCCWYMDRSKPLPPDKVFDPYRERDEERRLREYGPEVVRQFPASLTDRRMGGVRRGGAFGIRAER